MGPACRRLAVFALLSALFAATPAGAASCDGSPDPCPYTPPPAVFSHFAPGSIRLPTDVAVDPSGNTWVADFGHNQVVEYDSGGAVVRRLGRSDQAAGSASGELAQPNGLGVDGSGNVYVADTGNNRVQKFNGGTGAVMAQFGTGTQGSGATQLKLPTDVAVAGDGTVYIADDGNHRVSVYASDGSAQSQFGSSGSGDGQFDYLASIAVVGSHVYVLDGSLHHRVQSFATAAGHAYESQFSTGSSSPNFLAANGSGFAVTSGTTVTQFDTTGAPGTAFGAPGSRHGQFSSGSGSLAAAGVAFAGTDLVVADQGNARVQRFQSDGTFVSRLGGASDGEMLQPGGIAVDPATGNIWVADTGFNRIQKLSPSGAFIAAYGANGADGSQGNAAAAEFTSPGDIAIAQGADGLPHVYVADTGNNRIVKLALDGSYEGQFIDGLSFPQGVAVVGPNVYIADAANNRIDVMGEQLGNHVTSYTGLSFPSGVDVSPGGDIYVADSGNNRVLKRASGASSFTTLGSSGTGDGQTQFPTDVAFDATNGQLYVLDHANARVQRWSPAGAFGAKWGVSGHAPGQFSFPLHLVFGGAQRVFVADSNNDRIQRFNPTPIASPATVTLTSPANNAFTGDKPGFAGTASDAGSVHVDIHRPGSTDDVGFDIGHTGTSYSASYAGSLSEGAWEAVAYQNRGTASEGHSATVRFTVDTKGPTPAITSPDDNATVGEARPVIRGTAGNDAGDDSSVTVEFRQFGELKSRVTAARDGASFAARPDVDLADGGTFTVKAFQSDARGHSGESNVRTFTVASVPVNTVPPSFTGPGTVGTRLTGSVGGWSGTGPISYLAVWQRCADLDPKNCETVGGGELPGGLSYTVTPGDIGHRLLLTIVAFNKAGSAVANSAVFSGIVPDPDAAATGGSNGSGAGSPSVKPPVIGHTPAQRSSTCQTQLFFGPIGVKADCLKRVGLTWETGGAVEINGIHLLPAGGGAKIVIDPMNLRIAAQGQVQVVAGPATVAGRQIGPFTLYKGSFEWVFQPNVQIPDFFGLATAIPGGGGGRLPDLGDLARKSGLEGLASLPRLPRLGLPDFSKLSVDQLKQLRIPSLDDAGRMQIPAFYLPAVQLPAISVDSGGGIFGFPLEGRFAMRPVDDGAEFDVALSLKQLGNISAEGRFKLFNNGRFDVQELKAHADELNLAVVSLRPIDFHYDGSQDLWEGGATVFLPFPNADGIGGSVRVRAGRLERVALNYTGNLALGPSGVFLSHLDLDLDSGPPRHLTSNVTLTAGPNLRNLPPAVELDGRLEYQDETNDTYGFFRLTGSASLVGIPLGNALMEYYTNGYFHANAKVQHYLDSGNRYGFRGEIDGWVTKSKFNLAGDVNFTAPGFDLGAHGVISSKGVAGCAEFSGFWFRGLHVGAGYKWGDSSITWLGGSCDLSAFSSVYTAPRARVAQAGAFSKSVTLPKGLDATAFAVAGQGAPPKVTLHGPGGLTVTTPAGSLDAVRNEHFILVQDATSSTTYVLVGHPAAGMWTVTADAGSAPVTGMSQADALPDPAVRARVRGHGARRELSWTLRPIKGQVVRFVERSGGVARVLGETRARSGTLRFAPAEGPSGRRRIEAEVEQDGLIREVSGVAVFTAQRPVLAAPRPVSLRMKGMGLSVRWGAAPGATRYRVRATVNGGRRILVNAPARARRTTIPGVFADAPVTVAVTAVSAGGRDGRRAVARLRPAKLRAPRIAGLKPPRRAKAHS